MEEEERKRRVEMQKYFGPREFFRLGGFIMGEMFLGIIIAIILSSVFDINKYNDTAVFLVYFFSAVIAFPIVSRFWKPANSLMNKVIGNKNINIPIARIIYKRYPWYYYFPGIWAWILSITALYFLIKYLMK